MSARDRCATEHQEGRWLTQWLDAQPVATQPWARWVYHIKNEEPNATRAKMARGQGVRAGYPDYNLDQAHHGYFGLRIELKRRLQSASRVSPAQIEWQNQLMAQRYLWCRANGWREAVAILLWYANGPRTQGDENPLPVPVEINTTGDVMKVTAFDQFTWRTDIYIDVGDPL